MSIVSMTHSTTRPETGTILSLAGRALPADIQAERAMLGSIIAHPDIITLFAGQFDPGWFFIESHRWVFEAAVALFEQTPSIPPDLVTLHDELRRHALSDGTTRLECAGGLEFLLNLAQAVPSCSHAVYYAQIVQRTALLRQLIQVGGAVSAIGYDETVSVEALFAQAEQELFRVTQQSTGHDFESILVGIDDYFEALAADDEDVREAGLLTGYYDLDLLLDGGFHRGNLVLLAARPAMGKTALALSCALHMAKAGYRVGFISLEMGRREVIERLVAMVSGVPLRTIRAGNLENEAMHQVMAALGELSLLQETLFLDYEVTQQVSTIQAKVRRLHRLQPDVDIIFLDYLQLVDTEPSQWRGNRVQEVGAISRGLKQLGLELDIPVVALSQLSRAVEGRTNKVPMLSDLRESGELEQNADVVVFVYREEVYDKQTEKQGIAELHIAKHRQGCTGVVPLRFDGEHVRFQNLERGRSVAGYA